MQETTRLRDDILAALDVRFAPHGYRRRRDSQLWRRKLSPGVITSFHLNFGLYPTVGRLATHPSVGARHDVIERWYVASGLRTKRSLDHMTCGYGMSQLVGIPWYNGDVDTGAEPLAETLWADWCSAGEPYAERLGDLEAVVALLQSPDHRTWCTLGRGQRERLLLLALSAVGRRDEALAAIEAFRKDLRHGDQMVPAFPEFVELFLAHPV
jgi:hypothetical protein